MNTSGLGIYPKNLTYMVKRLSSYSRNTFKIQSLNSTTASAGQQIIVDFPSNTLVDCNTLTMFAKYTTTTSAGFADLPRNIESIIQRLEFEINGQIINGGANDYNHLWNIIADSTLGEDVSNRRKILQKATDLAVPGANITNVPISIQNWLGLAQVGVLNTRALGNVRMRITLAPTSIMVKSASGAGENYTLSDIFFSVDCFDLDKMFHEATEKFFAEGGIIEMPFPNFFSFSSAASSMSQTTKFSLSTQSLDKVFACFTFGGNYPANSASAGSADFCNQTTATSPYFTRPASGTIRFGQGGTNYQDITYGLTNYQFNVNGTYYPNYKATPEQSYALMLNAYNLSQDSLGGGYKNIDTLAKWNGHFWFCVQNFSHLSDSGDKWLSGLDTRGSTAQGFWETQGAITIPAATGTGGSSPLANIVSLVFAQCTSVLRLAYGRQLEIVQ